MKLFLCGDVMTGRGIDQILPEPSRPILYEELVRDARDYVGLAESASGLIPRSVAPTYIWGEALPALDAFAPDVRLINLETSITQSEAAWPKGINYRMRPANVGCLSAAKIDVCALANNHVLDYGEPGLIETIETLERAGIRTIGAGRSLAEAASPCIIDGPCGRTRIVSVGATSSGIPPSWAARDDHPGVWLLRDLSNAAADHVVEHIGREHRQGLVVVSIHWGSNWGYEVSEEQMRFAHRLVDGGIDIVHGHSSHHARPIEIYRERLILYGCGDLINDYEGIAGYEEFRADLSLLYLVTLDESGALQELRMVPVRMVRFALERASSADGRWLTARLGRVSEVFGSRIELRPDGEMQLWWSSGK